MTFLEALKRRIFGLRMDHPVFGKLVFESEKRWDFINHKRLPGYYTQWRGFPVFPPTNETITVFLPNEESAPLDEQASIYLQLVERWDSLFESISPQLYDVYRGWYPDKSDDRETNIKQMQQFICLHWVNIVSTKHEPERKEDHDFSLEFWLEGNEHFLGTDIKNWIPVRVQIR